jgi:uncharacterized protein
MAALILKQAQDGVGLHAARSYRPGDVVVAFEHVTWRPERDRHTIEHPFGGHLFHPLLARTRHSCEPNCRISFPDRAMIAVRAIAPGEAISFDYQTTERRLSRPFDCRCGSRGCRGRIA